MAGRKFAQINKSLVRSRKFRGLSHKARWAWLCAMLATNWSGVAEYPKALWVIDSDLPEDELDTAIEELTSVVAIEWSDVSETVRIVGFHKQRPPDNASAAKRLCDDFADAIMEADGDDVGMLLGAAAEFAVAAVRRAQSWSADSPDWPKLRQNLAGLLKRLYLEFDADLSSLLAHEVSGANKAIKGEIASLFPSLGMALKDTVSTPSPHPADTRRRRRDVDEDRDENEDSDLDGSIREFVSEPSDQASSLHQAQPSQGQRKGQGFKRTAQVLPMEETRHSALAMGSGR